MLILFELLFNIYMYVFAYSYYPLTFSDSEGSEDEFDHEKNKNLLMDKPGKVEGTLFEVERENRLRLQVRTAFLMHIHMDANFHELPNLEGLACQAHLPALMISLCASNSLPFELSLTQI